MALQPSPSSNNFSVPSLQTSILLDLAYSDDKCHHKVGCSSRAGISMSAPSAVEMTAVYRAVHNPSLSWWGYRDLETEDRDRFRRDGRVERCLEVRHRRIENGLARMGFVDLRFVDRL